MQTNDTRTEEKKEVNEGVERKPDVVTRHRPGEIVDHTLKEQAIIFTTENEVELRLRLVTPEIIQLQYHLEGDLDSDFSYAIDPGFTSGQVNFQFEEKPKYFQITTSSIICRVTKRKLLVHFYDTEGNVLCEDKHGFYRRDSLMKGISEIKVTKKAPDTVKFFGLGDKAYEQNLRGRAFENWNIDAYAYERGDDPLYRTIPFYLALNEDRAYGIFLDNTYRTRFSFDRKENNISSFSSEGGTMNYYFIYGPELTTVSERYTKLTGTPELPPIWAFGYHQCRWSYFPESRVRELADTFREKRIPCDAIYLDIDYMDDYRCFTWDEDYFPDPKKMILDLKEQGFETIVMIDPGIKIDKDYFVYKQGKEKGYFCRRPDGATVIAPVWPPKCAFPDFTDPDVRDWWANLYEDHMATKQISGIWNDMNEPAVFEVKSKTFPEDIRHDFDGHPCSHKKAHNIYGMQMARASLQGIKQHNPDKRPFLLTRANFAGGQRYAALWTGDNIASWDHLKLANEQSQRLSISGYSFVGSDIGGFVKTPSPELFTRWLQLSIFHPLFRNHTMGYNVDGAAAVKKDKVQEKKKDTNTDQEPWVFGDKYTEINRSIIELRYRLLNSLYTAFWKYIRYGTPVLRPLSYYDQSDENAVEQNDEFMFGDQILVSPVLDKDKESVKTYFPKGKWYDFRTNQIYEGPTSKKINAPIEEIPFFIKAGTVLPLREVMQYTKEKTPDYLELNIYYSETESTSMMYEDAEEGHQYKNGDYLVKTFSMTSTDNELNIDVDREGNFSPSYSVIKVNIIGVPFEISSVTVDGKQVDMEKEKNQNIHKTEIKPGFGNLKVSG